MLIGGAALRSSRAHSSSTSQPRLRPKGWMSASGQTADAQRCPRKTSHLRCPVRARLRGGRLRFDRCHIDGAFTGQVRRHPRRPRFSGQLRRRYGHGGSDNAAGMRLVRLLGRGLDHRSRAFIRARERATADADSGQPGWNRAARRHHRERPTGADPSGCGRMPLRAFLH